MYYLLTGLIARPFLDISESDLGWASAFSGHVSGVKTLLTML